MIITIDGPAGTGKSTVTRILAQRLGFQFLDTGAMYRAVTLAAIKRDVDFDDPEALGSLARSLNLEFKEDSIILDGVDVSKEIRNPNVARQIGPVADAIEVRAHLVNLQREIASKGNFICEGRDQGTVAFPNADCKIFLTASVEQRAHRRAQQMKNAGLDVDWNRLVQEQQIRDFQDTCRPVGKLQRADDAFEVDTDDKTLEEVVTELIEVVSTKIPQLTTIRSSDQSLS